MIVERLSLLALVALTASAAWAQTPTAPPTTACAALSQVPGVTHVRCSLDGQRVLVLSGHSEDGQLYRLEFGPQGKSVRVNGAPPVPLTSSDVVQLLRQDKAKTSAQRMAQCPSGEVVPGGGACDAPLSTEKDGQCFGVCGSFDNAYQTYYYGEIRVTPGLYDNLEDIFTRAWQRCMTIRLSQLESCSHQVETARLACIPITMYLGGAAGAACEGGLYAMNQYCTSRAPTCG